MSATQSNSELGTSDFETPTPERENAENPELGPKSEPTHSDRLRERLQSLGKHFTPPSLLTEPPPSLKELANYAHHASWTNQAKGPIRTLGVTWHRAVGIPTTAVCRYIEWIAQRPGRAITVFVVWKLLVTSGPGPWVVDNVLDPIGSFAGWIFL